MCPTELILLKNQKGSTCYLMTFYKRDSASDIFLEFSKIFRTSHFTKQLQTTDCTVKGFYLLRMSSNYCFRRAAKGQLSQRTVIAEILQLF